MEFTESSFYTHDLSTSRQQNSSIQKQYRKLARLENFHRLCPAADLLFRFAAAAFLVIAARAFLMAARRTLAAPLLALSSRSCCRRCRNACRTATLQTRLLVVPVCSQRPCCSANRRRFSLSITCRQWLLQRPPF